MSHICLSIIETAVSSGSTILVFRYYGGYTNRHTHKEYDDPISPLLFFQNEKSRLKWTEIREATARYIQATTGVNISELS
jgi:hypothetical protein